MHLKLPWALLIFDSLEEKSSFLTLPVHSHLKVNSVWLFLSRLSSLMPVKGSMISSSDDHPTPEQPNSAFLPGLPTPLSWRQYLYYHWVVIFHLPFLILLCQDDCFSLMKTLEWFSGEKVYLRLWENGKGMKRLWTIKPEVYMSLMPHYHQGDQKGCLSLHISFRL